MVTLDFNCPQPQANAANMVTIKRDLPLPSRAVVKQELNPAGAQDNLRQHNQMPGVEDTDLNFGPGMGADNALRRYNEGVAVVKVEGSGDGKGLWRGNEGEVCGMVGGQMGNLGDGNADAELTEHRRTHVGNPRRECLAREEGVQARGEIGRGQTGTLGYGNWHGQPQPKEQVRASPAGTSRCECVSQEPLFQAQDQYQIHELKTDKSTHNNPTKSPETKDDLSREEALPNYHLPMAFLEQSHTEKLATEEALRNYHQQMVLSEQRRKETLEKERVLQDYQLQLMLLEQQNKERRRNLALNRARPSKPEKRVDVTPVQSLDAQIPLWKEEKKERFTFARIKQESSEFAGYGMDSESASLVAGEQNAEKQRQNPICICTKQDHIMNNDNDKTTPQPETETDEADFKITPEEKAQILLQRRRQHEVGVMKANALNYSRDASRLALDDYEWQLNALKLRNIAQDKIGDERGLRTLGERGLRERNMVPRAFGTVDD